MSYIFEAAHASTCLRCDEEIVPGQMIMSASPFKVYLDEPVASRSANFAHADCISAREGDEETAPIRWDVAIRDDEEERNGPLALVRLACPRCFLELPVSGVCGNC